jgi:hypothetical protein
VASKRLLASYKGFYSIELVNYIKVSEAYALAEALSHSDFLCLLHILIVMKIVSSCVVNCCLTALCHVLLLIRFLK